MTANTKHEQNATDPTINRALQPLDICKFPIAQRDWSTVLSVLTTMPLLYHHGQGWVRDTNV